ncbi:MAG: hypothetical protein AAGD00_10000 [Planctomycetota bacterium]
MKMRIVAASLLMASGALASRPENPASADVPPIEPPNTLESVLRATSAAYLSDQEKSALRVFHGLWTTEDLETPGNRARAALIAGVWDDPVFEVETIGATLRAEAAIERGELREALEMLVGENTLRAQRLRVQALDLLGRFDEADAAAEPIVSRMLREQVGAPGLTDGVRGLITRSRYEAATRSDYENKQRLLSRAHQELDRLYWPAVLAEASLLRSKDAFSDSQAAALQSLAMNPRSAGSWSLLGRAAVDSFAVDNVEAIAQRLERLDDALTGDRLANPYAAEIRARMWLRQNEPDAAASEVDAALQRYPMRRQLLALRTAISALKYDDQDLASRLAAFEDLSPGSALAHFEVGKALSDARQYEMSAGYLEEASARLPNWAAPIIELGLMEMQSGRDDRALTALRRATQLDPFNVRARNSLRLAEDLLSWPRLETEHFIVRYPPGESEAWARTMGAQLDDMHDVVVADVGHEPSRKTVFELMPTHEEFAVRITGLPGIHTFAACTGPVIAMESPRVGVRHKAGEYDWLRVARHEYAHTVTLSRTKNRIPHWFTEAAAVHLELAPRDFARCRLLYDALEKGELFDLLEINIAFVRPERPQDRSLAYAQGHWMYEFIVERWGLEAPQRLMDAYAAGERELAAFERILGLGREGFREAFLDWARADAATWGMRGTPTLRSLRVDATLEDEQLGAIAIEELFGLGREVAEASAHQFGVPRFDIPLASPTPELVEQWLFDHPEHPEVLEAAVRQELQFNEGQVDEFMIPLLERYAAARPVDDMPHRHLARYYLAAGEAEKAIPHLEYLDARETYASAYAVALAKQYSSMQRLDDALVKAQRAVNIAPYSADHRELAATIALRARNFDEARRQLEALTLLEPDRDRHRQRLEALDRLQNAG